MKRWILTIISFAAVLGASAWVLFSWRHEPGATLVLPWRAHLWAIGAVVIEIAARSIKLTWSGKAVDVKLPFWTAVRTSLAGDFGASLTPARSGAEPARFLVLRESGIAASGALVVLFAELFLEALSLGTVVLIIAILFRNAGAVLAALVGVVGGYAAFVVGVGVLAVIMARRDPHPEVPPGWARRIGIHGHRWRAVVRSFAKTRQAVHTVKNVRVRYAVMSYLASTIHVAMRLVVLPGLVLGAGAKAPLTPLALWPLGLLYGAAVVPAPGGGGAVELAFRAALGKVIPGRLFAASLLWWRFYTFYLYIILGAIVAGGTAVRAIRNRDAEQEAEAAA